METGGVRVASSSVNNTKVRLSLLKKMAMQLAICSVIYIIFYLIKNTNYIFSDDVISKTKELLSYDINFQNVYEQVSTFVENNKDKFKLPEVIRKNGQEGENGINNEQANKENIVENTQTENVVANEVNGGIGGAGENEVIEEKTDDKSKKSQMELDAEYIKKASFKIPLKGSITSKYGSREKTDIVSSYHYGIDIGANNGIAIYASMAGTVTTVSSVGDYRKTCRNYKWGHNDKVCSL